MITFKQYSEIVSKISKKLKVSKDVASAALIKAQQKGIDTLRWQKYMTMLQTFVKIAAEHDPSLREKEYRSGDSWETAGSSWGGKNHDGDVEYYTGPNAKQMSKAWAKGQTKKRGNAHIAGGSDSGDKKPEDKEKKSEKKKGYFAVVLDSKSHKEVASLATFPKIRSHHVTIAFSPDEKTAEKLDAIVDDMAGKDIRINTSEYMKSDEIDALVVSGMSGIKREDPGQAHITVSHKEGVKPEKSKKMIINPEIRTPKKLSLSGKFQFITLK